VVILTQIKAAQISPASYGGDLKPSFLLLLQTDSTSGTSWVASPAYGWAILLLLLVGRGVTGGGCALCLDVDDDPQQEEWEGHHPGGASDVEQDGRGRRACPGGR